MVFEGGDTDKPMMLGSLYNGTHPPPFMMPGDKTRSGWRTQSSPGGAGFNELSFCPAGRKRRHASALIQTPRPTFDPARPRARRAPSAATTTLDLAQRKSTRSKTSASVPAISIPSCALSSRAARRRTIAFSSSSSMPVSTRATTRSSRSAAKSSRLSPSTCASCGAASRRSAASASRRWSRRRADRHKDAPPRLAG